MAFVSVLLCVWLNYYLFRGRIWSTHKSEDKKPKAQYILRTQASSGHHTSVVHIFLLWFCLAKPKHLRSWSESKAVGWGVLWYLAKLFPLNLQWGEFCHVTHSPSTPRPFLLRLWAWSQLKDSVSTPALELNAPQSPSLWKTVHSTNTDSGSACCEHQGLENSRERMFSQKNQPQRASSMCPALFHHLILSLIQVMLSSVFE